MSIEIAHLRKSFRKHGVAEELKVLDDITFSVQTGEFVSIVGESGCGKTTLLRMIAGLEPCSDGSVCINGQTVTGPSADCGMMLQQNTLFPWLTVYQNILFGRKMIGRRAGMYEEADDLLARTEMTEFRDAYPSKLSGGQIQRVALARALENDPKVLLLDEPLGALDAFTRMHMQDMIQKLHAQKKNTMVMITHDIDEAVYLSDHILIFSPRPARILESIEVKIPYPRDRSASEFVKIRNEILKILHFAGRE